MMRHILNATVAHTGTQFLRALLEINPQLTGQRHADHYVDGVPLSHHRGRYLRGEITLDDLVAIYNRGRPDRSRYVIEQLAAVGFDRLPWQRPEVVFIHHHYPELCRLDRAARLYEFPGVPTVTTLRDPLLAVITGAMRVGERQAQQIIAGFQHLAATPDAGRFYLPVDRPEVRTPETLDRLHDYLGLKVDPLQRTFWAAWPRIHGKESVELRHDTIELRAAYQAAGRGRLHRRAAGWAEQLRAAGCEDFFKAAGYRRLAWYARRRTG